MHFFETCVLANCARWMMLDCSQLSWAKNPSKGTDRPHKQILVQSIVQKNFLRFSVTSSSMSSEDCPIVDQTVRLSRYPPHHRYSRASWTSYRRKCSSRRGWRARTCLPAHFKESVMHWVNWHEWYLKSPRFIIIEAWSQVRGASPSLSRKHVSVRCLAAGYLLLFRMDSKTINYFVSVQR